MALLLWILVAAAQVVPLSDVRYDVVVSGPLADVELTQTFHNPTDQVIEATYLFPLHEGAVVDRMVMRLDDRTIEGVIEELEEAKKQYEAAIAKGQTAALTTAERWNLFRQKVGNIPPGAEVEVSLRVIQPVPRLDGTYELVLPLVAGARFVPPGLSDEEALAAPYGESPVRAHVRVKVDGGVPIDAFDVVSHLAFESPTGDGWEAHASDLPMTHDFVVQWRTADDAPQVGALHDGEHLLLVFEPPEHTPYEERRPRELVFLVDRSGSMQGDTWRLASTAVIQAMRTLQPTDRLRLVLFDGSAEGGASMAAEPWFVQQQAERLAMASPGGVTDLVGGLRAALGAPAEPGVQRYVVLVSDGLVANDEAVLAELVAYRGSARVFALGAGGAANRFVMAEVADLGGGTAHWLRGNDGASPMHALLAALDRPVLSGVTLDWGDWGPQDVSPSRIPDVHVGRPLTVVARTRNEEGGPIVVSGVLGTEPVAIRIDPRPVERGRAIASAWARKRIDALGRRQVLSGVPARDEGLPLALEYGILSPWTAFVAIDPREREVRTSTVDVPLGGDDRLPNRLVDGKDAPATGVPVPVDAKTPYATATSMAAGVAVGPEQRNNPNIGGAGYNENTYSYDDTVVTEEASRGTVLTREYLRNTPAGRSYDSAGEIASAETVVVVESSRESAWMLDGANLTDPVVGTVAGSTSVDGTPGWELVRALEAPSMVRPRGGIGLHGGAVGALPRGAADLALAVPLRTYRVGVRADGSFTRRALDGGPWSSTPFGGALLFGGNRAAAQLEGGGLVQGIGAPTLASFEGARTMGWAGARAQLGDQRAAGLLRSQALEADGAVVATRRELFAELGSRVGSDDANGQLAVGLRSTDARYSGVDADTLGVGGHLAFAGRTSRVVGAARVGGGAILRGLDTGPYVAPALELGLRRRSRGALVIGASRTVGVEAPELPLPTTARAYAGVRHGQAGDRETLSLLTGPDRTQGPLAPDVERLHTLPGVPEAWSRTAWVTELGWRLAPGHLAEAGVVLRHTALLRSATDTLTRPVAPWVPGFLLAHRPFFANVDLRLSDEVRSWTVDYRLAGSVASPLPGVPASDAWWTGWQVLASPGVALRRGPWSAGVGLELRHGRPDDPDLARPDGWVSPERLGAFGVLGSLEARWR